MQTPNQRVQLPSERLSILQYRLGHLVLSWKELVALVYVGIAVGMIGIASAQTNNNVVWFSSVGNLDLQVQKLTIQTDNGTLGYPHVIIAASIYNPSQYGGLFITDANYEVFVNSTSVAFTSPLHSEEVAIQDRQILANAPARASLNITFVFALVAAAVPALRDFLSVHNSTSDLVTYVGVTIYLKSSYGRFSLPYCYLQPGNILTSCPPTAMPMPNHFGG